jgi:hypothetical protein
MDPIIPCLIPHHQPSGSVSQPIAVPMEVDAYINGTKSFPGIANDPKKSLGHAFVVAMLLTSDAALEESEYR